MFIGLIVVAYIPVVIYLVCAMWILCCRDTLWVRKMIVTSLTLEIFTFIILSMGWPILYMVIMPEPHYKLFLGQSIGFALGCVLMCWWRSTMIKWVQEIAPMEYREDYEKDPT